MLTSNAIPESQDAIALLTATERARLQELEAIVEQGLQIFYEVGKALDEIRENKLYRETHKTFEAYCREKWNIARRTAYQFINAAQVMENLCAIAHKIPTKENQVRPLTGLPPELQLEIWQEAVESAPNGIPTGAAVKRLVEQRVSSPGKKQTSEDATSEVEQLRSENRQLREEIRKRDLDRERRSAEVALELERLRAENRQLKAELRQRDIDWERRLAYEREKIRQEVRAEIKAEYEERINSLTDQLAEMTAKYEAVLARLEAIEGGRVNGYTA